MIPPDLLHPPGEYSVMPFWFWNDALDASEIIRQIDDFQQHGVDGFVIHPRVGLPRNQGWMSAELLEYYRLAIEAARQRRMKVILYDEGMYPSGSASGGVVAMDPAFACRCLAKVDLAGMSDPVLTPGENLVAVLPRQDGSWMAVIDRPANSVIRGLHYIGEGPEEDEPPAADILNPQAVAAFIHLVYDRFYEYFADYFGDPVLAIFTDEPGLLGRSRESGIFPGTTNILEQINRILGYDYTPHLAALWDSSQPDAKRRRRDYAYAISLRLEETYYQPLSAWCEQHGLQLTGHPAKGDDIGPLRYFHIPGQDLVWRWVLPGRPSALEGQESTQAKCSSSAMINAGKKRNVNECCGAYGHELTWEEMNWLARWAFVRGVNWLIPHAFYYSIRGPRWNERPPDVGPHSSWWDRFPEYALACRRLSWINTDSTPVYRLAILGRADYLPWRAAKQCFVHQRDFNYIEERDILENAVVDGDGITLSGIKYLALIVEYEPSVELAKTLAPFASAGRVFRYQGHLADELLAWLEPFIPGDAKVSPPAPALRLRHVVKDQRHFYLLFNEEQAPVDFTLELSIKGPWVRFDPASGCEEPLPEKPCIHLDGYELTLLCQSGKSV